MAQANPNHTSHRSSDRIYPSLMGYTSRRPAGFPSIDRAALMRDAHRIASGARRINMETAVALITCLLGPLGPPHILDR